MTDADRIQRLREFSTGERGPYSGIADDVFTVLDWHGKLKTRTLLAETAVTACHSAMLGKVHPKSPAWGLVNAVRDHPKPAIPA